MTHDHPITILALANELKGVPFIEECKRQGCRVVLLTNSKRLDEPWPHDSIDELFDMPDIWRQPDVTYAVSYLARQRRFDRIVALDDYDVETAAALREHFRLEGQGDTEARLYRDKLAMRVRAAGRGLLVPEFTGLFNDGEVNAFFERVPPPWVLKPRTLAGSEGIRLLERRGEAWAALEGLGDRRSYHLLERFIAGDVFHVDALSWDDEVVFALASGYGTPPMAALQGRGIFTTRVLRRDAPEVEPLLAFNRRVVAAMGRRLGPTHTEFIRSDADGRLYFLETAARVGGGNIERVIEAATGLAIWQEAARIELADIRGERYAPPPLRDGYGGLIACPSRVPYPDTGGYDDPEIFYRPRMKDFASLVVGAPDFERVEALLAGYAERFAGDFLP